MEQLPLYNEVMSNSFSIYEKKFKALADEKRLHILYELCQSGEMCVCDMTDFFSLSQSKLSYHLKILLDANLLNKTKKGTWNYYSINKEEVDALLSEQLCCVFRPMS